MRILLAALVAAVALPASAQILYKLIDRQGRVTYTDSEPKKFDGTVIRIEQDTAPSVAPSPRLGEGAPRAQEPAGLAQDRRRARESLGTKLRDAQDRVEAARKARDEGREPLPDELQTIQHRRPPLRSGEQAPNPNCFVAADASGASVLHCPSRIPGESFYARQKKLEDDLRRAQEDLTLAERAYRRGTD